MNARARRRVARAICIAAAGVLGLACGDGDPNVADCVAETGTPGGGDSLFIDVAGGCGEEEGEGEGEGEGCVLAPYVADGAYDSVRGFGWLGPAEASRRDTWYVDIFPLGTHSSANPWADPDGYHQRVDPYRSWVEGLTGYRVDVPDGLYLVTLQFLESMFPEPGLRVFDVSSNGTTLIDDFDIGARAGQDEIVSVAVQVVATGGSIQLDFAAETAAAPVLAGLVVEPAAQVVPGAPTGLTARGGAGEVLLRWELPASGALRGWVVERSVAGAPFEQGSAGILPVPYFVDRGRTAGEQIVYRVTAVGASCSTSTAAETTEVTVPDPSDFGLPVIDIEVDPAEFASIHADPGERLEVAATVRAGAESATGTIRLRGASTRWLSKKSFRIKLDSGTIDGRDRLKLLAELPDSTRLTQLLTYDLYGRMAGLASTARPVLVRINGAVYGVYDDIEHVGDDFLTTRGYRSDGDRFRFFSNFGLSYTDSGQVDLSQFTKKENDADPSPELEALLVWINTAPDHEVDAALDDHIDVAVFIDYLAGQILASNFDVIDGGHYITYDPAEGRFLLIPWDFNNGTWERATLPLENHTIFTGVGGIWWSFDWLWTRALASPTFRAALVARLEQLLGDVYGTSMNDAVTSIHQEISPGLAVEPWLWRRRYEERIAAGQQDVLSFVDERRALVTEALPRLATLGDTGVVLAEVAPGASGYFVLENRSGVPADLASCWISNDATAPLVMSTVQVGQIPPAGRVVVPAATVAPSPDGGFASFGCVTGEEPGKGDEGGGFTLSSFVIYPPLSAGSAYVRQGSSWSVGAATEL